MSIATATRPAVTAKLKRVSLPMAELHYTAVGLVLVAAGWLAATTGLLG